MKESKKKKNEWGIHLKGLTRHLKWHIHSIAFSFLEGYVSYMIQSCVNPAALYILCVWAIKDEPPESCRADPSSWNTWWQCCWSCSGATRLHAVLSVLSTLSLISPVTVIDTVSSCRPTFFGNCVLLPWPPAVSPHPEATSPEASRCSWRVCLCVDLSLDIKCWWTLVVDCSLLIRFLLRAQRQSWTHHTVN